MVAQLKTELFSGCTHSGSQPYKFLERPRLPVGYTSTFFSPSLSNQHNNFCKLSVIIYPHHHRSFEHHLHRQLKKEKIHLQVILMSGTISIKSTRLTYMMATNVVVGLIARETTSSKQKKSK
ncbi:hypothetical protein L1987_11348 [Smallanthus sonchifolius]|uniref:Uncharacterized protein n=1 Tax=Smallanthus sonchifolius TaxID=185202 RepID=A0ACB9JAQ3_9ASTR|nr:hypothetical protein L1987_11348 [Smallanthus sonchifolius]